MNKSIECFVGQCLNNDNSTHSCKLAKIHIKKNDVIAKTPLETDCGDFKRRN